MDKGDVLSAHAELKLPERLNVRGRFNVAHRAAQFDNARIGHVLGPVSGSLRNVLYPVLNRIGDVRNHLHGLSEVVSPSFCFNHLGVDFTRGQIVVFGEVDVEEAFVISQVEVDFSSIIQNEDLTVFEG